ncbi:helix-turn-helix transcriptional regulator [Paludibaculum fermentans]|uniref:helix-turn-helix transcriptional regulator n=1 Tax=Paludibaculum fermentans TaxID=1473598 RepID=UPI003EB79DD6
MSVRRADRLFQIVQHLRARRLTTAAHLAEFLEVSERTVYRDIRDLSLSGIPVKGEAGVGYCIDPSFELTALMFTPDELEAVVVGLRMVRAFGGPGLRAAVIPALDKVALALPKGRRAEIDKPQIYAPAIHAHRNIDSLIDTIRMAVDHRSILELRYTDNSGSATLRPVRPLALHFWGSTWTLAAWCEMRVDFRSFRLDRMQACLPTGATFEDEEGKTLADYLKCVRAE